MSRRNVRLETERARGVRRAKAKMGNRGQCQACHWTAPPSLVSQRARLVHGHHIIPICEGGEPGEWNVVVLCPTCHAMAHAIGDEAYRTPGGKLRHVSQVRPTLIAMLRRAHAESREHVTGQYPRLVTRSPNARVS
jgi:hypothetical protein